MRIFQYEWDDESVSLVAAEDKNEAYDLLLEFGTIDIDLLTPVRSCMFTVKPGLVDGEITWVLGGLGFDTWAALPILEPLPKVEHTDNVIPFKKPKS